MGFNKVTTDIEFEPEFIQDGEQVSATITNRGIRSLKSEVNFMDNIIKAQEGDEFLDSLDAWSSGDEYTRGHSIIYNSVVYVAILDNINKQPDVNPTEWKVNKTLNERFVRTDANSTIEQNLTILGTLTTSEDHTQGNMTVDGLSTLVGDTSVGNIDETTDKTLKIYSAEANKKSLKLNSNKDGDTDYNEWDIFTQGANKNESLLFRPDSSSVKEIEFTKNGDIVVQGTVTASGINLGSDISPSTTNTGNIGSDSLIWGNAVIRDVKVTGTLLVEGTTTTLNTEEIKLADNIITLNSNFITGSPTENAGIEVSRGDTGVTTIVQWDETNDKTNIPNDFSVNGIVDYGNHQKTTYTPDNVIAENVVSYSNNTSSVTGIIAFEAPYAYTDGMHMIEFDSFLYVDGQSNNKINIGFYNNTDTISKTSASILGEATIPSYRIRYAQAPSGNIVILFGDVDTVWQYPKFTLSKLAHTYGTAPSNLGDWSTFLETDLTGYTTFVDEIMAKVWNSKSDNTTSGFVCSNNYLMAPTVCGTTIVQSPTVCGTTIVESLTVCGTTIVQSPTVCATTMIVNDIDVDACLNSIQNCDYERYMSSDSNTTTTGCICTAQCIKSETVVCGVEAVCSPNLYFDTVNVSTCVDALNTCSIDINSCVSDIQNCQYTKYIDSVANDTASGIITFSNITDSTSSTTGAVVISGGLGVAKVICSPTMIVNNKDIDSCLNSNYELTITKALCAGSLGQDFNANILCADTNVQTPIICSNVDTDLAIRSDGNIYLHLDEDNDGTSCVIIQSGADINTAYITEVGIVCSTVGICAPIVNVNGIDIDTCLSTLTTCANDIQLCTYTKYLRSDADDLTSGALCVTNTTDTSSASTGAFRVYGGIGICKNLYVGGTLTEASARKYKKDIIDLKSACTLDKVSMLQGVTYTKIDTGNHEYGLIADDVLKIYPELVSVDNGEVEGLHYQRITAVLVESIKELKARIEVLESSE